MRRSTRWLLVGSSAGLAAASAAAWALANAGRLRLRATSEEIDRPLPFDGFIAQPNYERTRAMTIDATPQEVWPFLSDPTVIPAGMVARHVTEHQSIVFSPLTEEAEATWVVAIDPLPGNRSRLISRTRARFGRNAPALIGYLLLNPAQLVFERRWLLEIKARAEELARVMRDAGPAPESVAAPEETVREADEEPILTI